MNPLQIAPRTNPHFEKIGGAAAVDRLVESFYRHMDTLDAARGIRAMHEADLTHTKAVLKLYLTEWLGGPHDYSRQHGHPRLRMRHSTFAIGEAERDAWMACMRAALDEVVPDAEFRTALTQSFFKTADWIRNDEGNPHDRSHR